MMDPAPRNPKRQSSTGKARGNKRGAASCKANEAQPKSHWECIKVLLNKSAEFKKLFERIYVAECEFPIAVRMNILKENLTHEMLPEEDVGEYDAKCDHIKTQMVNLMRVAEENGMYCSGQDTDCIMSMTPTELVARLQKCLDQEKLLLESTEDEQEVVKVNMEKLEQNRAERRCQDEQNDTLLQMRGLREAVESLVKTSQTLKDSWNAAQGSLKQAQSQVEEMNILNRPALANDKKDVSWATFTCWALIEKIYPHIERHIDAYRIKQKLEIIYEDKAKEGQLASLNRMCCEMGNLVRTFENLSKENIPILQLSSESQDISNYGAVENVLENIIHFWHRFLRRYSMNDQPQQNISYCQRLLTKNASVLRQ